MGKSLYYGDDGVYAVEQFDQVEMRLDGHTFDGVIRKIHPRTGEVTVAYQDYRRSNRAGDPHKTSAKVPVADVELMQRDM